MIWDRVIVGGGFAGLLAAYEATSRGEKVAVVESRPRTGGVIAPVTVGKSVVDAGAEAFSIVDSHVSTLVHDIGLGDDIVSPSGLAARIIGPTATTTIPEGIFGIPRDLNDPLVQEAVGQEAVDRARSLDSRPLPATFATLSAGQMVRERLGDIFLTHLVEPVIAGVHGVGADALDADVVFPRVVSAAMATGSLVSAVDRVRGSRPSPGQAVATIRGGMFRLTDRLAALVTEGGGQLMTGTRVGTVTSDNGVWVVDTSAGVLVAHRLTLANGPAGQLELLRGALGRRINPPGSAADSHIIIAHVISEALSDFPLGSGALVSNERHSVIRATTHINAKWRYQREVLPENHHLIRFSTHAPRARSASVEDVVTTGLRDLYGVGDAVSTDCVRVSWPGSLLTPQRGHNNWVADALPRFHEIGIDLRGALVSGNGLLGITHPRQQRHAA